MAALNAGCDMVLPCNQSFDGRKVIDAVIQGLTEAQLKGQWQPQEACEERRRALLPQEPASSWDDLMVQPYYMRALSLLP